MHSRARINALSCYFLCGVVLAVGRLLSAQTTTDDEPLIDVVDDEAIVLEVDTADRNPPRPVERIVQVPASVENVLKKDPILWAPDNQQASLRSVIPVLRSLGDVTMGSEQSSSAQVVFSFEPELLVPGKSRKLTLKVRNASSLSPGIYRGELVSHWRTLRTSGVVKYVWPVVLRVRGVYLLDAHFAHLDRTAAQSVLRAGDPMSVTARLLTVDCDRGRGALTLSWRRLGDENAALAPLFAMPLEDERPLDVALDLPKRKTALCPRAFGPSEWSDDVVWMESKQTSPLEDFGAKIVLHEVTARLPTCARLGEWEAAVAWQSPDSSEPSATQTCSTNRTAAVSGIRVHPQFPIATLNADDTPVDEVKIQILSLRNLGPEIPFVLQVGGQQSTSGPELLVDATSPQDQDPRIWRAMLAEPDDQAAFAAPYVYVLQNASDDQAFHPREVGTHEIRLHQSASEDARSELAVSRKFDVLWDGATKMGQDVILFVQEPPIHWSFFHSPREGYGRQVIRSDALKIHGMQGAVDKLHGELKALGKSRPGTERLWEWHVRADDFGDAPQVSFPNQRVAEKFPDLADNEGADGRLFAYQTPPDAENSTGALATWTEDQCPDNQLTLNVGLQLAPGTPGDQERLGTREFALRFVVSGTTPDGSPIHRIHNEVIVVDVKSAWEQYHKRWLIWGAILAGTLLTTWLALRFLRKKWAYAASEKVTLSTDELAYDPLNDLGIASPAAGLAAASVAASPSAVTAAPDPSAMQDSPTADSAFPTSASNDNDNEYARLPDEFAADPSNE